MNPAKRFGPWIFALSLACFCYWPALTGEFAVHNDYSVWSYSKANGFFGHPESAHLAAIGRPLGAVLLNLQLLPVHKISDFTALRCIAFAVVLLSAWLLARRLQNQMQLSQGFAACAATSVFLLPASQLFVDWIGNFAPGSLNVLFALLTYEVLDKVELSRWRGGPWKRVKVVACVLLAALLFLSSMCIYPATTLFILVPTFCSVLFSPIEKWPLTRRRVLRDVVFTIAGVGGYFLILRHVMRPALGGNFPAVQAAIDWNQTGLYQLSIERNPLVWLQNFWGVLTVAMSGFLHPFLDLAQPAVVAKLFTGGLLLAALWQFVRKAPIIGDLAPRTRRGYLLQAGLALVCVLAFSECPVVVPAGASNFVPYRVVYPASAMVALLLVSIVERWQLPFSTRVPAFIARPLPALILVGGAWLGNVTLRNAVDNSHTELALAREQLGGLDLKAAKGLLIIGPPRGTMYSKGRVKADFAGLATGDEFVPGFANALLEEKGIRPGQLPVRFRRFDPSADYYLAVAGSAIIDMHAASCGRAARPAELPRASVSASAEIGDSGNVLHAFDVDLFSFWEAIGSDRWLRVDYGQPYSLAEYSLATMQPPERMPVNWQLLGSNDGSHWTLVDQRSDEGPWPPDNVRKFSLAQPVQFCSFKIVFASEQQPIVRVTEWTLRHQSPSRVARRHNAVPGNPDNKVQANRQVPVLVDPRRVR